MAQGFIASQGDRSTPGSDSLSISAQMICVQQFTAPGSGTLNITEMGVYCDDSGAGGTSSFRLGIYNDDSNYPGSFVAGTAELEADNPAWVEDSAFSGSVTGGLAYWLATWGDTGNFDFEQIQKDVSGTYKYKSNAGTYPTWPNPFPAGAVARIRNLGIYAVYSAGGVQKSVAGAMTFAGIIGKKLMAKRTVQGSI